MDVKGRDTVAGLPKVIKITSQEIRDAMSEPMGTIVDSVRTALSSAIANSAPPVPHFPSTESRLAYLRWLSAIATACTRGCAT